MTNQDWESRMNELRDSQLVSQKLLERLEGTVNQIGENTVYLQKQVQAHEHDISELRAMMASLITNIDRFIQGRQSNGH